MFTGLIEQVGTLSQRTTRGNYTILTIQSGLPSSELSIGESIACDGACLTVVEFSGDTFTVEASQETAERTLLNTYEVGSRINLERALKVGDRMGGHYVLGHVDCTGAADYLKPVGESLELAVTFEDRFDPWVIDKGSIAINGVSLTVNNCRQGWLVVNLVPLTARETTLYALAKGAPVNLEFDLIGKYVVKMFGKSQQNAPASGLSIDTLFKSGW
jgi:riboflavin synthase